MFFSGLVKKKSFSLGNLKHYTDMCNLGYNQYMKYETYTVNFRNWLCIVIRRVQHLFMPLKSSTFIYAIKKYNISLFMPLKTTTFLYAIKNYNISLCH